ncbi:hypothetical protein AN618_23530 [Fervidicola ferrireducens]|uniref:Uncharacterized protein n=1 Tax=Fervidicola ferrireducens TaxID=520764 RepID=A0A140L182_9FIRM|nr:hypothetical protein [Fervidicola ferrireducens]KXG74307.1 hypothetical protein AN618_23530 [Fervidicola ferrireducens]
MVSITKKVKKIISCITIITILALTFWAIAIADGYYGLYGLITFSEDFLKNDMIDLDKTTAYIENDPPGTVSLPMGMTIVVNGQKIVAAHPQKYEYYVVTPEKVVNYAFDGEEMRHISQRDIQLQGAVSTTYSEDGSVLLVGYEDKVAVYGFTSDGLPKKMMTKTVGGEVVSLEKGFQMDFWLLLKNKAVNYKWNGSDYVKTFEVSGFTDAVSFSFSPTANALAVVDQDRVRYFMFNGERYVEISQLEIAKPNLYGIAIKPNGDYIVFSWDGTQYYSISNGKSEYISELSDPLVGIISIVDSPWGQADYIAVTPIGILYRGFNSEEFSTNYALSIDGTFGSRTSQGMGYLDEAELLSKPIPAQIPVNKVILKAVQQVPPKTSVQYFISTDNGQTWIPIEPDVKTAVPQGNSIMYKIVLKTEDASVTPSVDKVEIFQIGINTVRAETLGQGKVKVRLIK